MEGPKPKELVRELLALGLSKQQVFDQVTAAHPEIKPRRLAEALRNRPTLLAKERYANLHRAVLALIVLNAVLKLWRTVDPRVLGEAPSFQLLGLIPFATLFVIHGIYSWQGEHFRWIGLMNVLGGMGLLRHLGSLVRTEGLGLSAAMDLLGLAIGILCLYLAKSVFTEPRKVKDPMGGPVRYLFPEDQPGKPF